MSKEIRNHIGQLIIAGFAGTTIPAELRALARELDLGGIILFDRNVESPEQIAELAYSAQSLAGEIPLWISVDQEGGRVARFASPFTVWPPACTLGRHGGEELADLFARAIARELRAVGVTLDFMPVLDIHTNMQNRVIGDRALSKVPDEVARLGGVIVTALQDEGVAACGKHFPGHGDAELDSHHDLPVVEHNYARLHDVELKPFRAAIQKNVAAIMTAHILYPSLDGKYLATLSQRIVTDVLRQELGFQGLIVTDDLGMAAVADQYSLGEAAVRAVVAGCDMVLLCGTDIDAQVAVLEGLIRAVEESRLPARRIEDAFARQNAVKGRFLREVPQWRPPSRAMVRSVLGCESHIAVAQEMARHSEES